MEQPQTSLSPVNPSFTRAPALPGPGYLITLYVAPRQPRLGTLLPGGMRLSPWGRLVSDCWLTIPQQFPGTRLDAFQILPDRIQGVLWPGKGAAVQEISAGFRTAVAQSVAARHGRPRAPLWQRYGHARPIRNARHLQQVRRYLDQRPRRWQA